MQFILYNIRYKEYTDTHEPKILISKPNQETSIKKATLNYLLTGICNIVLTLFVDDIFVFLN